MNHSIRTVFIALSWVCHNFAHVTVSFYMVDHLGTVCASYLTLKVLVATIDAQWEGMGGVGSARYEPTLLPPCPTIRVLSCSN